MKKEEFESYITNQNDKFEWVSQAAGELHRSVGQTYDSDKPYSYHLNLTATVAKRYGWQVVDNKDDILPLIFGAYFHDSIEDARCSYNDVKKIALKIMSEEQALLATEIVYALTNEKGRTRAERANDKYYEGIRNTPYAPFVKMCDRMANTYHSSLTYKECHRNKRMIELYAAEWQHFKNSIKVENGDIRFGIPTEMMAEVETLLEL